MNTRQATPAEPTTASEHLITRLARLLADAVLADLREYPDAAPLDGEPAGYNPRRPGGGRRGPMSA